MKKCLKSFVEERQEDAEDKKKLESWLIMKRSSRIRFYRRVRAALLATNKRTNNSIITECNIVMPLANAKGVSFEINKNRSNKLKRVRKVSHPITILGKKGK